MKTFSLFFLLYTYFCNVPSFDELTKLPVDDFISDLWDVDYAGPLYEDEYIEK